MENNKEVIETEVTNSEKESTQNKEPKNNKSKKISKKEMQEHKLTRILDRKVTEGLTAEEVEERILYGYVNVGNEEKGKSIPKIIFSNLFTFFNLVFIFLTVLLCLVGSYQNLMFLITVIPNLIIGIYQEIKAKLTIEKLTLMSAPTTTVIRDGVEVSIPINQVVIDDIIIFTNGKQICCDAIVVEGGCEVNESMITGESDAISKKPGDLLYSGSFVSSGTCYARSEAIGKDCYIEKLAGEAKKYRKPNSELLRSLNIIFKIVSFLIVPLGILTFLKSFGSNDIIQRLLDPNNFELVKTAVTATAGSMIGMIPAGLFLLTSMALFVGVGRLARQNTLVQELYCIETLARVDTLCLDKTGTITDGTMKVWDCIEVNNTTQYTIREIVGSMMNAFSETNATSEALINYFDKNSILTPLSTIPFSSKRKYSAVTFENEGTFILGAPEFVLKTKLESIKKRIERYTQQGCRVLVIGHTNLRIRNEELPRTVNPIAIVVIQDHIRDEAEDTIKYFKRNGVDVRVISGDNPQTVSYIARRVGIENAEKFISLDGLTEDEVREVAMEYTVFGRVTPIQKKILVETFRKNKRTVAMTGDGVNDILALKEADCAIAMASGSEATRYVSHLVLMDSNFASMPKVVNEGRRVINNIQKTSTLFLVKTMFAITLTIAYLILGTTYIFEPRNLTMIEWFAIAAPAFFIALQPNTSQVKGRFILNVLRSTLPGALTVVIFHLALYYMKDTLITQYAISNGFDEYKTLAILITSVASLVVLFRVCKPFNLVRVFAFLTGIAGYIVMLSLPFTRNYLGLTNISITNSYLLIIFILLINPIMNIMEFILKKLKLAK